MDTKAFLVSIKPAKSRSKLQPWLPQLIELRAAGCTYDQLRQFLALNGVTISRVAIAAFMGRQQASEGKAVGGDSQLNERRISPSPSAVLSPVKRSPLAVSAVLPADWRTAELTPEQAQSMTPEQRRERRAARDAMLKAKLFPNPLAELPGATPSCSDDG